MRHPPWAVHVVLLLLRPARWLRFGLICVSGNSWIWHDWLSGAVTQTRAKPCASSFHCAAPYFQIASEPVIVSRSILLVTVGGCQ